jgi:hypothetical protein
MAKSQKAMGFSPGFRKELNSVQEKMIKLEVAGQTGSKAYQDASHKFNNMRTSYRLQTGAKNPVGGGKRGR